ncbi:MAG: DUF86 domain-containing protein [Flavobacteriaceae bacterium]|nr:DUF86 domain-containing protein [Flavobacteriaceae bacterium]MCY4266500.1 DUF86 domain-containing protein [Flavobacteriaceae bacterium]
MEAEKKQEVLRRLGHIREAIEYIHSTLKSAKTYDAFVEDSDKAIAISKKLQDIGESINVVYDIDKKLQKEYPNLQWSKMIGMRNNISHRFFQSKHENCVENGNRTVTFFRK